MRLAWLFNIAGCVATLLGFGTTASADITGAGCVLAGSAFQSAPTTVAQFTAGCGSASNVSGTYTFFLPANININATQANTPNGATWIALGGGTILTNPAAAAFTPATSGDVDGPGNSTWWDIRYTVGSTVHIPVGGLVITHDDGIVLLVNGVAVPGLDVAAPTTAKSSSNEAAITLSPGDVVDLLYDECGQEPAVLQVNLPGEMAAAALTAGSLVNGATYAGGGLVPGSWALVKGTGLSPASRTWGSADFQGLGNKLPMSLSGVSVTVNGSAAAVYYVDPAQVSFQVPNGVTGTSSVQVTNNGQYSNTITALASASSPGIFPITVNGTNYPAGVFLDGKLIGDPAVNPAFRTAKPGDIVQLFATGLVATPAGVLPTPQSVSGVTVTIGPTTVAASSTTLVAVGEFQINFTVPQLSDGVYPISITVNGASSPQEVSTIPPGPLMIPIQH